MSLLIKSIRLSCILLLFFSTLFMVSCVNDRSLNKKVMGGRLVIKNDILDKEFNSFFVDSIITAQGIMPYKKFLSPGDRIELPYKKIKKLRFVRQYVDHAKVYTISCPMSLDEEVTIKLIDVHTNRIAGGCFLTQRGVMTKGGVVRWEGA